MMNALRWLSTIGLTILIKAAIVSSYPKHPNVLLIIIDDLRPILGCYGDDFAVTPNIDGLAQQGIVLTRAYAQQTLCGPSRTSFLTSRRPDTTKLYDVHSYWRTNAGNFTTLPQYFKEHGYHTLSVGKVFHPGIVSNHSDDQPYSWSETPYHPPTQAFKQAPVCLDRDGSLHSNIYCPVEVDKQPGKSLPDIETTAFATQWLENRSSGQELDQPFFMAVGYHKPHIPLKFPANFLDFYPIETVPLAPNDKRPRGMPTVAWNPWNDLRRREDIKALNVSFPYGPLPRFYARYIRQGYYAATTYVDSLIGKLLSKTRELFPDTIVALIGDHGWSLGEHQEWSKFSNFEVATRVPFIISKLDASIEFSSQRTKPYFQKNSADKKRFQLIKDNDLEEVIYKSKNISSLYKESLGDEKFSKYYKRKVSILPRKQFSTYDGLVELVDLFPTLVDLTGLHAIRTCSVYDKNVKVCTEGKSLAPILWKKMVNSIQGIQNNFTMYRYNEGIQTAFSQYPRPSVKPSVSPDSDQPRTSETKIMGYSLRTRRFRYTVWLKFDNILCKPDWSRILAQELYDHKVDPNEDHNVLNKKAYRLRRHQLFQQLMSGWQANQSRNSIS